MCFPFHLLILNSDLKRICQQRYSNPRGRDLAMVKTLALCNNAINYAK